MVLSSSVKAFDINQEPENVRAKYGDSDFGRGCLLGPPAGRGGRHVRRGAEPRLGHARRRLQPRRQAERRMSIPAWPHCFRSERARPARSHADRLDGRIRPHAEDQSARRPRPLSAGLQRGDRRRRHPRRTGDRLFGARRDDGQRPPRDDPRPVLLGLQVAQHQSADRVDQPAGPAAAKSSTAANRSTNCSPDRRPALPGFRGSGNPVRLRTSPRVTSRSARWRATNRIDHVAHERVDLFRRGR